MVSPNRATFMTNSDAPSASDSAETSHQGAPLPGWDAQLSWYERIVLWVLRQGTIPRHFAIVADGNRRFSRIKGIALSQVYYIMFHKITTLWPYMTALGVPEVTVFMISTRNMIRNTTDLVTALDEMMKFFGRTLHSLIARLRLCVAYNTKVGLKSMVLDLVNAVQAGDIEPDDITAAFIAEWLAVSEAPETELWFRSSGEVRLSEFLVLQSGYSYIHIDPELWPAITFWNWVWAVLQFQLKWPYIKVTESCLEKLVHRRKNGADLHTVPKKIAGAKNVARDVLDSKGHHISAHLNDTSRIRRVNAFFASHPPELDLRLCRPPYPPAEPRAYLNFSRNGPRVCITERIRPIRIRPRLLGHAIKCGKPVATEHGIVDSSAPLYCFSITICLVVFLFIAIAGIVLITDKNVDETNDNHDAANYHKDDNQINDNHDAVNYHSTDSKANYYCQNNHPVDQQTDAI
ncbi:hypothetical protein MTO96_002424 [Rhipicephalus appendiculatus]